MCARLRDNDENDPLLQPYSPEHRELLKTLSESVDVVLDSHLDEQQKHALRLRRKGKSFSEIAEGMGISPATARRRVIKAQEKMAIIMKAARKANRRKY